MSGGIDTTLPSALIGSGTDRPSRRKSSPIDLHAYEELLDGMPASRGLPWGKDLARMTSHQSESVHGRRHQRSLAWNAWFVKLSKETECLDLLRPKADIPFASLPHRFFLCSHLTTESLFVKTPGGQLLIMVS